ncbi:MAG: hypothetical protein HRU09_18695 [Oligoflexales bacterium]|nr:hypothetical protein [Oligoflexales bacterium]
MWIISYADLMTLLFATFVVLYGLKSAGETKEIRGIVTEIREAFVEIPDIIEDPVKGPTNKGLDVFESMKLENRRDKLIERIMRNNRMTNEIDEEVEELKRMIEPDESTKIPKYFKQERSIVSVYRQGRDLVVSLSADFLYDGKSFRLKRSQVENLKPFGRYLASLGKFIKIQAYVETSQGGFKLAALRASFLRRYFAGYFKAPTNRSMPYGHELSYTGDDAGLEDNVVLGNRVDIKILYEE